MVALTTIMKRLVGLFLVILLLVCVMPLVTSATSASDTRTIGDSITTNADGTLTLNIGGGGEWTTAVDGEIASQISKIVVADGVTDIGAGVAANCTGLKQVEIPLSVQNIADNAFPSCNFEMVGYLNHASGNYAEAHANVQLKLKQVRLLLIGNSHTDDYSAFFSDMIADMGDKLGTQIQMEKVLYGGRQLILDEEWTRSHYLAAQDPGIDGHWDLVNAFAKTWDLVLIQDYRESIRHGAAFAPQLQEAVRWINESAPGAKIGWVADWAEIQAEEKFTYVKGAEAVKAVQALASDTPDFIIPMSIMVENARSSYMGSVKNTAGAWLNDFFDGRYVQWYPILERDMKHMSLELGRYVIGTGVMYHIMQYLDDLLILEDDFDLFATLKTAPVDPNWAGEFVDEYRLVAKEAALNAQKMPLFPTQSQYTVDPAVLKLEEIAKIMEEVLPWSVIKERLNGQMITAEAVDAINQKAKVNLSAENFDVTIANGYYEVVLNLTYGYSSVSKTVLSGVYNGIVDGYYYVNGVKTFAGLILIDSEYYYIKDDGLVATGSCTVNKTNNLLPAGTYQFDESGKLIKNGIFTEKGTMYYYANGEKTYAGLIKIGDDYYYVNSKCIVVTGHYTIYTTNNLMPADTYEFGTDGKMIKNVKNGIVAENGAMYYYVNGVKTYAGLIKIGNDYYYVNSKCMVVTGAYNVWKTNNLMAEGVYHFGADGKMVKDMKNGIVTENGAMYYYVNGVKTYAGLIKIGNDYYYVNSKCMVVTGAYNVWKTNNLMAEGVYHFGADGKMVKDMKNGIVTENGAMYYYVNGVKTYAGLIKIGNDYYYVNSKCIVVTGAYNIWKTNNLMAEGIYHFGADGKMVQ